MKPLRVVFFAMLCPSLLSAGWTSVGNVDGVSVNGSRIVVRAGTDSLALTFITPDVVHVWMSRTTAVHPAWAVVHTPGIPVRISAEETKDALTARSAALVVRIDKHPLRISFFDTTGESINAAGRGIAWDGNRFRVWRRMPQDECYYGFGEKANRLEKRSTSLTMWNSDIPGYGADTDPIYESIPFFYGIRNGKAYGILLDNSFWSSFDIGKEDRQEYSFGAGQGPLSYYFFAGPAPAAILGRFTELVGRMPLPPLWSLGYQQCRWSYAPEKRVREIADGFRSRRIPCDVIYLDIDYMDGYRIFTWDHKKFPDPKKMISDLGAQGFKIAVIVDPGIKTDTAYTAYRSGLSGNHFVLNSDGSLFKGDVWPGECAFPDFADSAARTWWGNQFSILVNAGVRGWWNDMNEPAVFSTATKTIDLTAVHHYNGASLQHSEVHNVYGKLMTQATYQGVRALAPDVRPFVLTRASYTGGQQFAAAWTGDNNATWEHLRMAVPMCLNLSISGQPFVGTDIGGFNGHPSGELFARWLQLGVFTPLMRAHSVINEVNKEPWEYGDQFTAVNRETIELRYRLLPYIYNAMRIASLTGIPPMRPLAFDFPDDADLLREGTAFMFGKDLLVAPVLDEAATTRTVRLPAGRWFYFYTDSSYAGHATITVPAPINRIPFFVREGAIVPMRQVVQYTEEAPINPLTLRVYRCQSDTTVSAEYYEDDGISYRYFHGEYLKERMTLTQRGSADDLTIGKPEGSYLPPARNLQVRFAGIKKGPRAIRLDGMDLHPAKSGESGWFYDSASKTLTITFPDNRQARSVTVDWQ